MARKLASIERVWKVEPIEGADKIELAHVLGWQCVVNKGQFKPMDLGVYFEIDSFLPIQPEFEFLRTSSYRKSDIMGEGFKLKTMRFKGQVSQGLLLPLSVFGDLFRVVTVGESVANKLGVRKWEEEERATTGGTVIGGLPYDVPKTDETRCFVGRTKITTNLGKLRIADIVNKKLDCEALTYNELTQTTEWRKITNYYKRKETEPTCKICFPFMYNGNRLNSLKGSLNHKVMTQNGWTKLEDIAVGDSIFLPSTRYTDEVIPFIAGMLLGDSCINLERRPQKDGSLYKKKRIGFCQGEKQLPYLKEKLRILGSTSSIREGKSGYCDNSVYSTSLKLDDTVEQWLTEVMGDSETIQITKAYTKYITPISLAFWYMDDGSLQVHKSHDWQHRVRLHTESYAHEEIIELTNKLKEYGFDARVYESKHSNGKTYEWICLTAKSSKDFQALVAPYMMPEMRYKLDEEFRNVPYLLADYTVGKVDTVIEVPVLSKEIYPVSPHNTNGMLYNIETEQNHNYFANGVLVHNCQACPELIEEFRGLEYYISTKMDGSSHSISIDTNGVHVTGHNYEYKDDGSSSFYEFVKKNGYLDRIMHYAETHQFTIQTLTIQGEFCAPGVQGNPVKLTKPEWYVFTIRVNGKRVSLDEMLKICRDIDIPTVPIEERGFDLPSKYPTVDAVLERAEGYYSTGSRKEGIVIRPTEPVFSKTISASLSMKAVSNTYLLKKKGD